MDGLISRQDAIDALEQIYCHIELIKRKPVSKGEQAMFMDMRGAIMNLPFAQPEDYSEMKQEFLRLASYVDVLLECSDEQKETLLGFISRMSEFMPWNERD